MSARDRAAALYSAVFLTMAAFVACRRGPESQQTGVEKAERFTSLVAVEQRFGPAYAMLSVKERERTTRVQLEDDIRSQLHGGCPTRVRAVAFELVPQYHSMRVFLICDQRPVQFHYSVVMREVGGAYYPDGFEVSTRDFPKGERPRYAVVE